MKNTVISIVIVICAILVQSSLGAIYAWSVFTQTLKQAGWSTADTQWPFIAGLVTFAIVMVYAGKKLSKIGPRKLTIFSALLLGSGYIFAGLTGGTSFWSTLIGIGILGGAGIGLGYVVPITVGMQWFPDKKGLITGITVAGFGLGAMIWVKLAGSWGNLLELYGLANTFIIYGILFMLIVLVGSIGMIYPKKHAEKQSKPATIHDFNSSEMLRTSQYLSIFTTFAIGATAGLMCIGLMKIFPIYALEANGIEKILASSTAGTAMAIFALANAIGRIGWGKISDIIGHAVNCDHSGRRTSLIYMMLFQAICIGIFPFIAGTPTLLYLFAALIGFNFGGNFALFPAITTDTFGQKYFGQNYGFVFLAYGIGGTIGPILGGYLGNINNFALAFFITSAMSVIAVIIISKVKIPKKDVRQVEDVTARIMT